MVGKSADNVRPAMAEAVGVIPDWEVPDHRSTHSKCEQCHTMDPLFSHPVNVSPSMNVPARFPLEAGRLTCQTCHATESDHGPGSGPMLRSGVDGLSLCQQCHTPSGRDADSAHAAGLGRAHLTPGRSGDVLSQFGSGHLDSESATCVSCHDGTYGGDAGDHGLLDRFGDPDPRSDHPVGVDYRARRPHNRDLRLVEPSRLDERVRLFDRTVGCGSCHSPYSGLSDLLVVSNQRSQLCLTCHIQ